ncbi:MAG: hypothetical protein GX967_04310, partial [Clostridiales bacterium]|nr:hypothetical protein [Clostridiales bacterium]
MKIKHIIRIVLGIFIFVPMLVMLIAIRGASQQYATAMIREGLELTVKGEADNISTEISKIDLDLKLISDNAAYREIVHDIDRGESIDSKREDQVYQYLKYVTQKSESVIEASLLDLTGNVMYSSSEDLVGSKYELPSDLLLMEEDEVYTGHSQDYLNFMKRMFDGVDLIGYAQIKVKLGDVHFPLLMEEVSNARFYILWDENTVFDYKDGDIAISDLKDSGFKNFLTQTHDKDPKVNEYSDGKSIAYSSKIAGSSHWFIGVVNLQGANAHTAQVLRDILLFTLPIFIVLLILSYVVADMVMKPFN